MVIHTCFRLSQCLRSAVLALGFIVPSAAFAELTNDTLLGPGVRLRPAYDGSASHRGEFVPVIRYLGEPWFVRSTQGVVEGGLRMELVPGLHVGAQLAYESGRKAGESAFLKNRNVADISRGASWGVHAEWDHKFGPVPITVLARARQRTDTDLGAQFDLRLSAGIFQSGAVAAGVFAQSTWANAKSTSTLYGVTQPQSVATGLPQYGAGSGWLFGSAGLLWSVTLHPRWMVVGSMEVRRLQGDAAHSPLVERSTNHYLSAGLAYRY